jgi:hypothetical protein
MGVSPLLCSSSKILDTLNRSSATGGLAKGIPENGEVYGLFENNFFYLKMRQPSDRLFESSFSR